MSTPNRPSDQWSERETAVLEASGVYLGLTTVDIGNTGALPTKSSGATVFPGAAFPLAASVAGVGFATVHVGMAERYSFKYFANANTSLATTFAVKGSAGFIHTISVGSTSNPTIGLFNHATTATNPVFVVNPGTPIHNYVLDESLANGLVAEVSEGSNTAINISYK